VNYIILSEPMVSSINNNKYCYNYKQLLQQLLTSVNIEPSSPHNRQRPWSHLHMYFMTTTT